MAMPAQPLPPALSYRHSLSMSTPQAKSRKRKRPQEEVRYREEREVDDTTGTVREVIVIEDTPPPQSHLYPNSYNGANYLNGKAFNGLAAPPPLPQIRTRAQAAAAAASALSASGSSSSLVAAPPPKKRKRDAEDQIGPGTSTLYTRKVVAPPTIVSKPWATASAATAATEDSVASSQLSKAAPACDDKEGHYIVVPDDVVGARYRTVKLLGQGTFGKVVQARDLRTGKDVAIKIIRAIPKYREASTIEIRVLRLLKERDPLNKQKCIHLLETFDHRNHVCIVTELLGMCIYDFLKENDFAPFPRVQIQAFARQLLTSVAFLHDLQLVHTDLKPENILLVNSTYKSVTIPSAVSGRRSAPPRTKRILQSCDIRLIDFGSATFEKEYHSTVVSTRHYRAPEIILGLGWSFPCDAFSLGCILVEFYTGVALFQTHDNLEHLAMMEMVMGKMPDRFARAGARSKGEFFKEGAKLDWPKAKASKASRKEVRSTKSLQEIIPGTDIINRQFLDLVRQLLMFDPATRITVRDALQHPYFSINIPSEL